MNVTPTITKAAYARHRGCAKSAVTKAIAEGRITAMADGTINARLADLEWAENSRARGDSGRPPGPPAATPAQPEASAAPVADQARSAPDAPPPTDDKPDTGYNVDRARREKYEADMAEMKLLEQQGQLVRISLVRLEMDKQIGQLKGNLLQIPARLGHLLTPEAKAALMAELRGALTSAATEAG